MSKETLAFLAVTIVLAGPLPADAEEQAASCDVCHAREAQYFAQSVHASLRCQECHGGESSYAVAADQLAPLTQPAAAKAGVVFDHGDSFRGRPQRAQVPDLCGNCHADVERMNPYGLRTDQLARYRTSGHGKALFERQDTRVAVCTDCHGPPHEVLRADNPKSHTHPLNVPSTCGGCHEDQSLMDHYDLPAEVVEEYRRSVHGTLLLEQQDTGAPACATCHGNHSAMPPGFASVGAVCGQCHEHVAEYFNTSVHATETGHKGCVQCHGGGEGRHFHLIERITQPAGIMIQRYAHLLASEPEVSAERIAATIHPDPKEIINRALPTCMECHDEIDEDESLPILFAQLDEIAKAERHYVETAARLDEISKGMLLVENQRFKFEDAKTHLIALAPLQHTLDNSLISQKVADLNAVCDEVNRDLDELEAGLAWRRRLLIPIWVFAVAFALVLYAAYRRLHALYVELPGAPPRRAEEAAPRTRRSFLDGLLGLGSAVVGAALAIPAMMYLWPAARGGGAAKVEVEGASSLQPGQSVTLQVEGKVVIVVRGKKGFKAFSAACTHLGCLVKWDAGARNFKCPCHAAVFDENGEVVSGPPPSPLPQYTVKEVGDKAFVTT